MTEMSDQKKKQKKLTAQIEQHNSLSRINECYPVLDVTKNLSIKSKY